MTEERSWKSKVQENPQVDRGDRAVDAGDED